MHTRILWLLSVAVLLAGAALAQTQPRPIQPQNQPFTVEGQIKLEGSTQINIAVFVQLYKENDLIQETITHPDGRFLFTGVLRGRYRLVTRLTGYESAEEVIDLIGRGGIVRRVIISMSPEDKKSVIPGATSVSVAELQVPKKADKEYRKGRDKLQEKDYAGAAAHFRKAVAEYPTFSQAWNDLGLACRGAGDAAGAERAFRECLRHDASNLQGRLNLAELCNATGRAEEARQILEETAALHPAEAEPHRVLGDMEFTAGRLDAAEAEWRRAVAAGNANPDVYLLLAKIYLQRRQGDQLVEVLEAYLAEAPDGPYAPQVRASLAQFKKQ